MENNKSADGPGRMGNSDGQYARGLLEHWIIKKGLRDRLGSTAVKHVFVVVVILKTLVEDNLMEKVMSEQIVNNRRVRQLRS